MRMNYLDSHSQGCRIQHIFSSPNDESWWPQDAFSEILHGISSEMQAWNLDVVDIPLNNRSSIGYFSYERNNLVLVIATFAFSFFFRIFWESIAEEESSLMNQWQIYSFWVCPAARWMKDPGGSCPKQSDWWSHAQVAVDEGSWGLGGKNGYLLQGWSKILRILPIRKDTFELVL